MHLIQQELIAHGFRPATVAVYLYFISLYLKEKKKTRFLDKIKNNNSRKVAASALRWYEQLEHY